MWKSLLPKALILLNLGIFSLISHATANDPLLVVSQWPDGRIGSISTSIFQRHNNGPFELKNSLRLNTENCDSMLQHYQLYSLEAMLRRHLITQDEFDFYQSMPKDFDFRQIAFFHSANAQTIASAPTHDWLGFNYAALAADSIQDRQLGDLVKSAYQYLKTDASLWLIRGQLPTSNGKLSELFLPWLREGKFREFFQTTLKEKIRWEVGRAAHSNQGQIRQLFHASILQAAHESVLFGIPLQDAAIYAHTPSQRLAEHYQSEYGLQILGNTDDGDYLLRATLDQLIQKFPPDQILNRYARTRKEMGLRNEQAIGVHQTLLEAVRIFESQGNEKLSRPIVATVDKFWGFVFQKSLRITHYENMVRFGQMSLNYGWNKSMIPTSDLSTTAIQPRNGAILISQLSEQDSERFPNYLERVLAGVWHAIQNELKSPGIPIEFVNEFYNGARSIELLTSSEILKQKAELLGGVWIETGPDYQEKMNYLLTEDNVKYELLERTTYRIRFSVSRIQQLLQANSNQEPFIATSETQQALKMMNGL